MSLYLDRYRPSSARLPGWDYATPGYYFVTLCANRRQPFFGEILDGEMRLSPIGETADHFWLEIPAHFPNTDLDEYIIMPNHVHGIIVIKTSVEPQHATALPASPDTPKHLPAPGSLSAIIRSYKSAVTRWSGKNGFSRFAWQSRFYDHIIRDDESLDKIRRYIQNNPYNWETDEENPIFHPR